MSNQVGRVAGLFISKKGDSQRTAMSSIILDEMGVLEDKFYAKDIDRSILLTSLDSYNLAKEHSIDIPFGYLGENILMDFNPYKIPIKTKLQIGEAVVEISQNCTICNHLSTVDKRLPKLLKNDRGIFAKVIKSAAIKIDDKIYTLDK